MQKSQMLRVKAIALRAAASFLLLFCAAVSAHAQDVRVNCPNPTCTLTPTGGVSWSGGNLTFIFVPTSPHNSIYVYLHNNNSTSAHTSQTISIFQTPYGSGIVKSLTGDTSRWVQDVVTQNGVSGAQCNNVNAMNPNAAGASGLGSCGVQVTFAAQIAINISGASGASGSPDTYDLAIVQDSGNIGANTGTIAGLASIGSGLSTTSPLQVIGDLYSEAYGANAVESATTNTVMLEVTAGSRQVYFDKLLLTNTNATSAAQFNLNMISAPGTGCTTLTAPSLSTVNPVAPTATTGFGCSGAAPIITTLLNFEVAPLSTIQIDLRGIIAPMNSGGLQVVAATTVTGNFYSLMEFYER